MTASLVGSVLSAQTWRQALARRHGKARERPSAEALRRSLLLRRSRVLLLPGWRRGRARCRGSRVAATAGHPADPADAWARAAGAASGADGSVTVDLGGLTDKPSTSVTVLIGADAAVAAAGDPADLHQLHQDAGRARA